MGHGVGHHIDISIHALREEGDAGVFSQIVDLGVFLSRPSAWWATNMRKAPTCCSSISIHALREVGDAPWRWLLVTFTVFLSTPSARRATMQYALVAYGQWISIHALREEGDRRSEQSRHVSAYFYPRPPRGGRLLLFHAESVHSAFLSTPSVRRATLSSIVKLPPHIISIHALREEGDRPKYSPVYSMAYFYPRPP